MTFLHVTQEQYTLHSNSNRSAGTIHGSLALIDLLPCFTPWHFSVFITNWFIVAYKHVIGLKTDVSQSNLGGNTDSNHLIPGVVGHFPSVSLRRRPVQLVILIPFFFSPASDAGFSLFCAPPCISAPVSILPDAIRPFRMSFPRHRMPVFFPLYGEVRSSLLRFNPATISWPLRTSTSRPFFVLFAGL